MFSWRKKGKIGFIFFGVFLLFFILGNSSDTFDKVFKHAGDNGKSRGYVAPPGESFRDFFSREGIKRWAESWTHIDRLVVLKRAGLIIVVLAHFNPNKFTIDIYDLDGNLIYDGIETGYRLYCADEEDNLYFIDKVEGKEGINSIVKKYRFAGDVKR